MTSSVFGPHVCDNMAYLGISEPYRSSVKLSLPSSSRCRNRIVSFGNGVRPDGVKIISWHPERERREIAYVNVRLLRDIVMLLSGLLDSDVDDLYDKEASSLLSRLCWIGDSR